MIQRIFDLGKTGKNLLITAGIHGNQHSSILLAQNLCKLIKNGELKPTGIKTITIINFINQNGIYSFQRENQNGIDLNRQFLNDKSNIKQVQYIKQKIKNSDIIIDLHSSFNSAQFLYLNNDKFVASYIQFLDKLDLLYVINEFENNSIKTYANSLNKVGFTFQMNQNGNSIDEVSVIKSIIYLKKLLNSISLLNLQINNNFNAKPLLNLQMNATGKLKIICQLGKVVEKGQLLGYINNGEKTINILSPCKGTIIVYPSRYGYISIGSPIIAIQPI